MSSSTLTHLGYAIKKASMQQHELLALRKELTVAPKLGGKFAKQGDSFSVFLESSSRMYLPRMWAKEKYGEAQESILVDGDQMRSDLAFVGKPYDYQVAIVDTFINAGSNGLICVPCGRGKTFMAIAAAARIGRRFLIVVDKEFLLQQWSGELQALMPGIRIGIIQEHKKQIVSETILPSPPTIPQLKAAAKAAGLKVGGNKDELTKRLTEAGVDFLGKPETVEFDCCIAMIQTLVQREFSETDFRPFGLTIFDECHHLGAAHFSRALMKVQTKYMLGLSATPTRDDGLTKVFEWFLGKPVYWEKTREADPDVIVRRVGFDTDDPAYAEVPTDPRTGDPILARLLTQVVECEARNQTIDGVMADLVKDAKRRILVLSERKSHLDRIERGLPAGTTVGYYIGGMKEEVREEGARTAQVLLGTYAMASEAMNIKTLNTMVMASPRKKIEQSTGRILRTRKDEREVVPLIVDIVDSHGVYQGQWFKRRAYYKRCAYKIEGEAKKGKAVAASASQEAEAEEEGNTNTGCLIVDD
jgi:superfamily II DNA or RNA helicase